MKQIIFLCVVLASIISAQDGGGNPGAFMQRGAFCNGLAMGNAYTAVTSDITSIYWNPAGLSCIENTQFSSMFSVLKLDRSEYMISIGHNFNGSFTLALGAFQFGVKNIDGRDIFGNPTGSFDDAENCFMASLAKKMGMVELGVTGKYVLHSLKDNKATGKAFDLGIILNPENHIRVGLVAKNLLGSVKWDTDDNTNEDLLPTYKAGVSVIAPFFPITVSADIEKTETQSVTPGFGLDVKPVEFFGLRAGYNNDLLSFGTYFSVNFSVHMQVDYAAVKDVILDQYVHHVSLSLMF